MRRTLVGVVLASVFVLAASASACGDDQPGPRGRDETGGTSGKGGRSGSGGSGGSEAGGGGAPSEGGTGQGGTGQGGRTGGRGGTAGRDATGGSVQGGAGGAGGDAGDSGGEGGSAGEGGGPDQLTLCQRLQRAGALAISVTLSYETALVADCRVNWTTELYFDPGAGLNERDAFLNNLHVWNLDLWGCTATSPSSFALIYVPAPLTSADARALIDDYVGVAQSLLSMSPLEVAEMRALLDRLSQPVIERVSDEYSKSYCDGGGGAGGAGGAGGS